MTDETATAPPRKAPDKEEQASFAAAARQALESSGGWVGIAAAALPTAAFVAVNSISGLDWAFIALAGATPVAFGIRIARREPVRAAVVGLVVAAVCAAVAALSGDARAFFLIPTVLPAVFLVITLGSLLVRRPLTAPVLNRMAGGPRDWRRHAALRRIYTITTWFAVAFFGVNFVLRLVAFLADQLAILTVLEVAAAPAGLALAGFSIVAARRAVASVASVES
ncbi:DUF3159 domain-containing protein [Pseudonocardia humida]|uniref:DUF3159 domain-containing protein n=1 Tax=Pseudonocardia humida TaxID=2800819 RepID=A0ABT1A2C2_9PSEU|nr:DUF3159 domain-containing protein [Pseudonocardia humida]MCO1657159.1 DUF3159 domain-containing protein [Pseudonocardia humida]